MAKPRVQFVCQNCGTVHTRWAGKCDACGAWNTLVEEGTAGGIGSGPQSLRKARTGRAVALTTLSGEIEDAPRIATGIAIVAIRDHPIAAASMGINIPLYKSLTFGVSAMYTGVAGALGREHLADGVLDGRVGVGDRRAIRFAADLQVTRAKACRGDRVCRVGQVPGQGEIGAVATHATMFSRPPVVELAR